MYLLAFCCKMYVLSQTVSMWIYGYIDNHDVTRDMVTVIVYTLSHVYTACLIPQEPTTLTTGTISCCRGRSRCLTSATAQRVSTAICHRYVLPTRVTCLWV